MATRSQAEPPARAVAELEDLGSKAGFGVDLRAPDTLPAAGEAEWQRLRRQIELADGFWIAFVFTPSPRDALVLRERMEGMLRARAQRMLLLRPETPEALERILPSLLDEEAGRRGWVWLEAVREDPPAAPAAPPGPWSLAWERLFLRLNERRDRLGRHLRGLVIAAPAAARAQVREAAPDLWSVRGLVLDVPGWRLPPQAREVTRAGGVTEQPQAAARLSADLQDGGAARFGDEPGGPAEFLRRAEGLLLQGRAREAIAAAAAAVESLERLARETDARGLLPAALATLARAEAEDGDRVAAVEHLRRAHAMREVGPPDRAVLRELELWFDLAQELGDHEGAAEAARDQELLSRRLLETQGETPLTLSDLSLSLQRVGDVRQDVGERTPALAAYEESLALARRLLEAYGETPQNLREVLRSLIKVGDARRELADPASALAAYEESLALARRLLEAYGESPQNLRGLAVSLIKVGDVRHEVGEPGPALAAYEEALALDRRLLEAYGETPHALRDLSVGLERVGDARWEVGERGPAMSAYEETLALRRRLVESSDEALQALRDLSVSLEGVGDARREVGEPGPALEAYEESLALRRRLLEAYGETPQGLLGLSLSLERVGDMRQAVGESASAQVAYEEGLALGRRHLEVFGEAPLALQVLSGGLDRVGDLRRWKGEILGALELYREALDIDRRRARYGETPRVLRDLAVSLRKVIAMAGRLEMEPADPSLEAELAEVEVKLQAAAPGWEEVSEPGPEEPRPR